MLCVCVCVSAEWAGVDERGVLQQCVCVCVRVSASPTPPLITAGDCPGRMLRQDVYHIPLTFIRQSVCVTYTY